MERTVPMAAEEKVAVVLDAAGSAQSCSKDGKAAERPVTTEMGNPLTPLLLCSRFADRVQRLRSGCIPSMQSLVPTEALSAESLRHTPVSEAQISRSASGEAITDSRGSQ